MAQIVAALAGRTDEGATYRKRRARLKGRATRRLRDAKDVLIWEELMPRLVGFSRFAAFLEEQISEKINLSVFLSVPPCFMLS